jgi:hypothetical protein
MRLTFVRRPQPTGSIRRIVHSERTSRPTTPQGSSRTTRRALAARPWLVVGGVAALLTAAVPAHAETTQVVALAATLSDVIGNIRNWIMGILFAAATMFLTWGGLRYLAATEPGDLEKAKAAFKNAGYGYVLAALAPLIVTVLQQIVGGT